MSRQVICIPDSRVRFIIDQDHFCESVRVTIVNADCSQTSAVLDMHSAAQAAIALDDAADRIEARNGAVKELARRQAEQQRQSAAAPAAEPVAYSGWLR